MQLYVFISSREPSLTGDFDQGQQDRSKPLSAPVFVPLLSAAYGSSALVKYVDKLSSVIAEGPQSKELEVTPLMVAMTATAVCRYSFRVPVVTTFLGTRRRFRDCAQYEGGVLGYQS